MDFNDERVPVGYGVAMVSRILTATVKKNIEPLNITPAQIPFLCELLRSNAPLTQDTLSAQLLIDPAATARAIENLEKKGLVKRKVNPENRRQKLVSVTDKANWMKGDFRSALNKTIDEVLEPLEKDEQEELSRLLTKICKYHQS